jgi:hypothetical protein
MKRILAPAFLIVAVFLIGSELAMRVFFTRNMSGRFEYGYHPTAGFVEESEGKVKLVRAGGRRFRPQEFTQPKPQGLFRAFVVGDSVPRGPSLEQAYAWQLGQMLRDQGAEAEVFNLAVGGFGVRRNQIVLKKALEYRPDLLVLHVNGSNEFEDEREWRRAQEFKSWHPSRWLAKSVLVARLYELKTEKLFWELLPGEIRSQAGVSDADAELAAGQNETLNKQWRERVLQTTRESVHLIRQSGCRAALVLQATLGPDGQLDGHGLAEELGDLAGPEVLFVPMQDVLEGHEVKTIYADGAHLRPEGHRLMAEALARQLRERGWVSMPPGKK